MRLVPVGKLFAKVDDADYGLLSRFSWSALKRSGTTYAFITNGPTISGKHCWVAMHRVILSASHDRWVDHIDGDGLNNCKDNLRLCNASENGFNSRVTSLNTSGFKGVSFHKPTGKYQAYIVVKQKHIALGYFHDPALAGAAYDRAAAQYAGEFARFNQSSESRKGQ